MKSLDFVPQRTMRVHSRAMLKEFLDKKCENCGGTITSLYMILRTDRLMYQSWTCDACDLDAHCYVSDAAMLEIGQMRPSIKWKMAYIDPEGRKRSFRFGRQIEASAKKLLNH